MQTQRFLPKLLFLLLSSITVSATCYSPWGIEMDPSYQPCNGSAPVSMCCHLGYSNNGGDMCGSGDSYGLCGITGTQLWRESCTDPTWESASCLDLCLTPEKGATGDIEITACPNGSYCCGSNNAICCEEGQGLFIVNNMVVSTRPSTRRPSTTPAAGRSSLSTPLVSASPPASFTPPANPVTTAGPIFVSTTTTPSPPTGLSSGAKAGIGTGAALGSLALLGGAWFWARKRHQNKNNDNALAIEIDSHDRMAQEKKSYAQVGQTPVGELEARPTPVEMPAEDVRK